MKRSQSVVRLAVGFVCLFAALPASGLSAEIRHYATIWGEEDGLEFGAVSAFLGDWDGDGYDDLAVSAPGDGKVFLFRGGFPAGEILFAPSDAAAVLRAESQGDGFGRVMRNVGDVTGDGVPDLLVAAPEAGPGKVYLFSGAAGLRDREAADADAVLSGTEPGSLFGAAVAGPGDPNDDGKGDVLIGAPGAHGGPMGRAGLFLGPILSSRTLDEADAVYHTTDPEQRLGYGVELVGDMSGDRFGEIAVGGPVGQGPYFPNDALYLFFGAENPGSRPVLAADAGIINPNENTWQQKPPTWFPPHVRFGQYLWRARDYNGDGFDDLLVGGHSRNSGYSNIFLLWGGRTDWITALPRNSRVHLEKLGMSHPWSVAVGDLDGDGLGDQVTAAGSVHLSLSAADYVTSDIDKVVFQWAIRRQQHVPFLKKDRHVMSGGDLNGDGLDDILSGVPGHTAYGPTAGVVEIWTPVPQTGEVFTSLQEVLGRIRDLRDRVDQNEGRRSSAHGETVTRLDGLSSQLHDLEAELTAVHARLRGFEARTAAEHAEVLRLLAEILSRLDGLEMEMEALRELVAKAREERIEEDLFENRILAYMYTPEAAGGGLEAVFRVVERTVTGAEDLGIDAQNARRFLDQAVRAVGISRAGDPVSVSSDLDYKGAAADLAKAYRQVVLGRAQ